MLPENELERRLRLVEPAAYLVPERILRRVIKQHAHPPGIGLRVPHHKSYVLFGVDLAGMVKPAEVGLPAGEDWPAVVILLRRPESEELAGMPVEEALRGCWRLLFHARIHVALDALRAKGRLDQSDLDARIRRIGATEFEEIENVLRQENYLLPPADRATVYLEFAALFLELRHFEPGLAADFFPALRDAAAVEALLAEDVDVPAFLKSTRLEGAEGANPLPQAAQDPSLALASELPAAPSADGRGVVHDTTLGLLLAQADRARAKGNVVRAGILRCRAAALIRDDQAKQLLVEARTEINRLVERLQPALELSEPEMDQWRHVLPGLLPRLAKGFRTVESRLLYDLQKVCVDHEREIYSTDAMEWIVSLGKLAIKRPMPAYREVLRFRHLHSASRRWRDVRLPDPERQALKHLLDDSSQRMEDKLRDRFRPAIAQALSEVDLQPENLPERIAHDKLIEELLDRIAERGFVTISDLRDALSRNQLKLPDLAGPGQFFLGDKLIRLNRRLPILLDGVYHHGEIYRRWLQRFSSLAFGTKTGRFLTRFLALPFGGAFVALDGLTHLLHEGLGLDIHLSQPWNVALLGAFLLGMLQFPLFRNAVVRGLQILGWGLRAVFIAAPAWVLGLPAVQGFLESGPVRFFRKWLLKPLLLGALTLGGCSLADVQPDSSLAFAGAVFLGCLWLFNSRFGRDLDEAAVDWLARTWQRIRTNLLPNLFRWVMDLFRFLLDLMERLLYKIDEWFRFKSGESRLSFVVKVTLGPVWGTITYVVRFGLNLLIEPQINPIKHFPVVTVSHKLLLPTILPTARWLSTNFTIRYRAALPLVTGVIWCIPGIFGFLVWELKENWRLYRANRPKDLVPVPLGSHGETVVRLLRRGFHSGTQPRLYARLRKARRKGRRRAARRAQEGLHHVEIAVRRFVDRELLALLRQSPAWAGLPIVLGEVRLATNRIVLEVRAAELPADSLWIYLDDRGSCLWAWLDDPTWLEQLSEHQRLAFATALAGFFRVAGVEQFEANKSFPSFSWETWVQAWEKDSEKTKR